MIASLDLARPRPEAASTVGIAADHLAVTVRELGAIALDVAWMGTGRPLRRSDQIGGFSTVGVEVAHDLLGLVGAVLSDANGGPPMNVEWLRLGFPNFGATPVGLAG